jgi:hypothetical protein
MSIIYYNGNLTVTNFKVQELANGQWVHPVQLLPDHCYRFVTTLWNNAGDPQKKDLSALKVIDLLNPFFYFMLPRGKVIVFSSIKVSIAPPAAGIGAYRFFQNSDFSGPFMPVGSAETRELLRRGDTRDVHVYFKWATGPFRCSGSWPGGYVPQVSVNARELQVTQLPPGPVANLQPAV